MMKKYKKKTAAEELDAQIVTEKALQRDRACGRAKIKRKLKPCGCVAVSTCLNCGREDRYPEDYHRDACRVAA